MQAVRSYKINTLWLTSALFNLVVDRNVEALEGLAFLLTGGEVISAEHVRRFKAVNKKIKLINCYGPTENTTFTTTYEIPDKFDSIPIGKAIPGTEVYIMNGTKSCMKGEEGELCTAGCFLFHPFRKFLFRAVSRSAECRWISMKRLM